MRFYHFIVLIFIISCDNKPVPKTDSERSKIIEYLKSEYRIKPDPNRFDSNYTRSLIENHKSLEVDSLINSNLHIVNYKPLNLSFIKYYNGYYYKDAREDSDMHNFFTINLIRDNSSGKIYLDWINDKAGWLIEPFCAWSHITDEIEDSIKKKLKITEVSAYKNIKVSKKIYGDYEIRPTLRRIGIEQYFNSVYQYKLPSEKIIYDLTKFYDDTVYSHRDTLLKLPEDLYRFFAKECNNRKDYEDFGENSLSYLKEQINFLLLKNTNRSRNSYLWVFDRGIYGLRVRELLISGNEISRFSYVINEYEICF